tara:strand:+ start:265 stop:831 length:567 start_codon:yes stop_codon:yes gene_type:complete
MGLIVIPALFLYLIIACVLTWYISKIPKKESHRWLVLVLCIFIFTGILIGDAVLGRVYVKYLCSKDGGIEINEKVILEPDYFDEKGRFLIDSDAFFKEGMLLKDRYRIITKILSIKENIDKRIISVWDFTNNKEIAHLIYYSGGGGWIEHISPGGGIRCPNYNLNTFLDMFFLKVFLSNEAGLGDKHE